MRPRRHPRPPIGQAMPLELRRENSPERCVCSGCHPEMSPAQRAEAEATQAAWRQARTAWCLANGYTPLELLRSERVRSAPSKKRRAATADTEEVFKGSTNRKEAR